MEPAKTVKITDENAARIKAEHYCAYQERSQQEVRDKLYEWGLFTPAIEQIITGLITDNFLSEERFAKAYAQGKFRQKAWGKIKIRQGLKFKRVPDVLIRKALLLIDADEYLITLQNILDKKASQIAEKDPFKRHYKIKQYAMGRGFEADLIEDLLR